MIKIKSYKAGKGDAFLLSFGENKEHNIMIDMGISATYSEIKSDLELLAARGKKLDLLVVTHMHEDHICGAIKFIEDNDFDKKIIKVDEVWHNSYRHLKFDSKEESDEVEDRTIRVLKKYIERQEANIVEEDKLEKISVRQGFIFSKFLNDFDYSWNSSFDNQAIMVDNNKPIKIGDDIKIILISPNEFKLNKLSKKWLLWLKKKRIKATSDKKEFEYAFEFVMRQENSEETKNEKISSTQVIDFETLSLKGEDTNDTTAPNGASIAFILEYKGKKLLFLGDAHEDIIYKNLNELSKHSYALDFDLVKLSHHGSIKNISNRLLSLISSKRFLISTNGKGYGQPSMITLAKIIMSKRETLKQLIFNYSLDVINELKPYMKDYNYEVKCLEEIVIC
jgi:beta-lactamase superfamily II metal-dependent hydrolase